MEHPAEEWDRAALQLEPVRIDIPWSAKGQPEPGERISWVILLAMGLPLLAALSLDTLRTDGWAALAWIVGGTAVVTPLVILLKRAYYHTRNQARRQAVLLQGATFTLERFRSGARTVERYPVLEMHDLRLLPRLEFFGEGVARHMPERGLGAASWEWPERIAFTHGGRAYSFGGPVDDETAQRALTAIVDYDARLRAALGMPAEPNIATYDAGRAAAAAGSGYDIDKHPFSF